MKSKRPGKRELIAFCVLGLLAVRLVFFRAPSEAAMLNNFQRNKAQFEQISSMMQQDPQVRYISSTGFDTMDWKRPTPQQARMAPQRLSRYRALMKQLGVQAIVRLGSPRQYLRLEIFGGGFTDTSWGIGYSWSAQTPKPLVKSAYWQYPGQSGQHFSPIEDHWYIYHRR